MVRFLKLALCALVAGLAIVACGGGSSDADSSSDKLTIVGSGG
ncbi:MAG: hypothetical protein JWN23_518 [Rhodocyclales bacterium]|nr:hypothetical protein [Rhodocyclales bacterium]